MDRCDSPKCLQILTDIPGWQADKKTDPGLFILVLSDLDLWPVVDQPGSSLIFSQLDVFGLSLLFPLSCELASEIPRLGSGDIP